MINSRDLEILSRISEVLAQSPGPSLNLKPLLAILSEHLDARRSFVLLSSPEVRRLSVVASGGLSALEFRKLDDKVGAESLNEFVGDSYEPSISRDHSGTPLELLNES